MLAGGGGTLCVFSSVAGDRGRKPVILYGASKRGAQRLPRGARPASREGGLRVVTVKPGFVEKTAMTAGKPPPSPASRTTSRRRSCARDRSGPSRSSPRCTPAPWAAVGVITGMPASSCAASGSEHLGTAETCRDVVTSRADFELRPALACRSAAGTGGAPRYRIARERRRARGRSSTPHARRSPGRPETGGVGPRRLRHLCWRRRCAPSPIRRGRCPRAPPSSVSRVRSSGAPRPSDARSRQVSPWLSRASAHRSAACCLK